jgi:hypothetical protein
VLTINARALTLIVYKVKGFFIFRDKYSMYYKNLNTVFVQITKNASSSVDQILSDRPGDTHTHDTLGSTQDRFGHLINDETFYFAIVRNPVDRFISAYCYLVEERQRQIESEGPEFAWKYGPIETLEIIKNMNQREVHELDMVFLTQNYFLQPLPNSEPRVELLVYENLEHSWIQMAKFLQQRGLTNLELPFSNKTKSKQGQWNDPLFLKLVHEIYADDFQIHQRAIESDK